MTKNVWQKKYKLCLCMIRIFPGEPPAQLNQTWHKLSHAIERLRRFRYLGYNKLQGDIGLKYRVGYIYIYIQ